MADISKTAGKVVYEYYFATQGAQRMNAPKSLSQKLKKHPRWNWYSHCLSMIWNSVPCPGISKCSVMSMSLKPRATQVLAADLKSWWNLWSPTLRLAADVNSRIFEFRIRRSEDRGSEGPIVTRPSILPSSKANWGKNAANMPKHQNGTKCP